MTVQTEAFINGLTMTTLVNLGSTTFMSHTAIAAIVRKELEELFKN